MPETMATEKTANSEQGLPSGFPTVFCRLATTIGFCFLRANVCSLSLAKHNVLFRCLVLLFAFFPFRWRKKANRKQRAFCANSAKNVWKLDCCSCRFIICGLNAEKSRTSTDRFGCTIAFCISSKCLAHMLERLMGVFCVSL